MKQIYLLILLVISFGTILCAQTRRMNNAEGAKEYGAQLNSRSIESYMFEADRQFRALDFDGAFLTLENAVNQDPYSPEALMMRAKVKRFMGMNTEAEEDIRMVQSLNPQIANLFGYYGVSGLLQALAFEPEEAITALSTYQKFNYYFIELDRELANGQTKSEVLLDLEMVISSIEAENLDEALQLINLIITKVPESAIAHDLKGVILFNQGNLVGAEKAVSQAVILEPEFAIAWYNFGVVEKELGNYAKAKLFLDRAIALQDDLTKAYFVRALLFKKLGQEKEAIEDYNKVIEIRGKYYTEAFLNRGLTKKMSGDYGGAMADINQVIRKYPKNEKLWQNRGNLYLIFELPRKAIDDYTQALTLNRSYPEAYYNRAMAQFLIYDKVSGCHDLRESAKLGYERAEKSIEYFCGEY